MSQLKSGDRVLVHGRKAIFVKAWGAAGAVVRYDDLPHEPKVVPFERVALLTEDGAASRDARASGDAP